MYHVFIYSSVDGLLGYFHILAIVYSTAVNSGMHVPIWTLFFSGVSWFNRLIKWVAIDSWLDLQPLSPPWRPGGGVKSSNPPFVVVFPGNQHPSVGSIQKSPH